MYLVQNRVQFIGGRDLLGRIGPVCQRIEGGGVRGTRGDRPRNALDGSRRRYGHKPAGGAERVAGATGELNPEAPARRGLHLFLTATKVESP
jgi:hypothetical protein